MLVDKISLKNFKKYENFEIDFNEQLTVIVGKNQSGKTTILDGIAVGFTSYLSAVYPYKKETAIDGKTLIRHAENRSVELIETYPCFPLEVYLEGATSSVSYGKEDNMIKIESLDEIIRTKSKIGTDIYEQLKTFSYEGVLPVIVYYSINRKKNKIDKTEKESLPPSRINGYTDCLNGELESQETINWIKKLTFIELQRREKLPILQAVLDLLIATAKSLYSLDDKQEVTAHFNVENDCICLWISDQKPSVKIMNLESDGFKSVIYLVLDIAYRMATLNPQLGDNVIKETEGIVLIDEVDLHLHPEWQQKILGVLTEVFPKVQFIVTTHAPAVINSVKKESLIILNGDNVVSPSTETYGRDMNFITNTIMGATERPKEVKDLFEQFRTNIDEMKYNEAREILTKLENILETDDPELAGCKVILDFEEDLEND